MQTETQRQAPGLRVLAYGPDGLLDCELNRPEQLQEVKASWPVVWVDVDLEGNESTVLEMGEVFGLHHLALEDVIHLSQRPKVEEYDDHLYIVARMLSRTGDLATEQLSLFLGKGFLLTFQETPGDCLDDIRARIRKGELAFRSNGPDYLAYLVLDSVIDAYFPILEQYGDEMADLEDEIIKSPQTSTVASIHHIRNELFVVRRAIWPLREEVANLYRQDSDFIRPDTKPYLRDCHDHTIQIIDLVETYRELAADLMDVYLSSMTNRTNEIMRVLTVFATIFMPLSFITGLYGMNFENMPELSWKYGYGGSLALMAITVLALVYYFKRRGWLGSGEGK